MKENRERNSSIRIRMNQQEYESYMEKYEESGLQTQREFVLKMCLSGYLVKVDLSGLNKVAEELNKIGVNINQIAHRVNAANALAAPELKALQENMDDINHIIRKEFIKYKK